MKMDAAALSETVVTIYQIVRRHISVHVAAATRVLISLLSRQISEQMADRSLNYWPDRVGPKGSWESGQGLRHSHRHVTHGHSKCP
jgi:hypothetical protein